MRILIDATLPLIHKLFPPPFIVNTYASKQELEALLPDQDILLCRSTLKVDATLLKNTQLRYVATASSGTDHIDAITLAKKNIQLLDAKGCNAISVADYVLCTLAALKRAGILSAKKAGLIGRGAVGSRVLERLQRLDFEVQIFDPPLAGKNTDFNSCTLNDLTACNIILVHAALHDELPWPSRNLLNFDFLVQLKPETIILNASRGGIVNEQDLLRVPFKLHYCTDVFENEPAVNPAIINYATICTPHIAGHSMEAKNTAVKMISDQLHGIYGLKAQSLSSHDRQPREFQLKKELLDDANLLALYDPTIETNMLKDNPVNAENFQNVRTAHSRHDFFIEN